MKIVSTLVTAAAVMLTGAHNAIAQGQKGDHKVPVYTTLTLLTGAQRPQIAGLEGYQCFGSTFGWIFTKDTLHVRSIDSTVRSAAARFDKYLSTLHPGAFVLLAPGSLKDMVGTSNGNGTRSIAIGLPPHVAAALRAAGAAWVFQWMRTADVGPYMQQLIPARESDSGKNKAILRSVDLMDEDAISHEISHIWFDVTYGNDRVPDWLNESGAVLEEGPSRRLQLMGNLLRLYHADPHSRAIVPLDTFFIIDRGARGTYNGIKTTEISFYEECRGLIDFLLEHAGKDQRIFASIAEGAVHGETMAQWLQANGRRYGLPTTVPALDLEWREWLGKQIPPQNPLGD